MNLLQKVLDRLYDGIERAEDLRYDIPHYVEHGRRVLRLLAFTAKTYKEWRDFLREVPTRPLPPDAMHSLKERLDNLARTYQGPGTFSFVMDEEAHQINLRYAP